MFSVTETNCHLEGGTLVVVQLCRSEGFGGSKDDATKSFTSAELCDHQSASSRWQLVCLGKRATSNQANGQEEVQRCHGRKQEETEEPYHP